LRMLVEDLSGCDRECEDLRFRGRELLQSVQHFKEENEILAAENRSLKDAVASFEGNLDELADRNAQLIGHTNKKQKIRYTIKLKEECSQLRAELAKARSRLAHLEGARRCEGLFLSAFSGAASDLNASKRRGSLSCSPSQPSFRCLSPSPLAATVPASAGPVVRIPGGTALFTGSAVPCLPGASPSVELAAPRTTPRRPLGTNAAGRRAPGVVAEQVVSQREQEQAARRCRLQERALERISADYQHLVALVERAVSRDNDTGDESTAAHGLAEVLRQLRGDLAGAAAAARDAAALRSQAAVVVAAGGPQKDTASTPPALVAAVREGSAASTPPRAAASASAAVAGGSPASPSRPRHGAEGRGASPLELDD